MNVSDYFILYIIIHRFLFREFNLKNLYVLHTFTATLIYYIIQVQTAAVILL